MYILLSIIVLLIVAVYAFMQHPQFGKPATGERLERIKRSPNYKNNQFQNLSDTPQLTEGATYYSVMKRFFFTRNKRSKPPGCLPVKKFDLLKIDSNENILVWFGHSSYFMQINGKKFLVDPVLSGSASPVSFTTKSFTGTDAYSVDELPHIYHLLITHDHYDHLDHKTVSSLKEKVDTVITGLGVGAHLEHWGYENSRIIEKDWNEAIELDKGFTVHTAPARHFSGRSFKRNSTLWSSFILTTPAMRIYIGGDSGYDDHFKTIGEQFGPFDLVILENGQYDKHWKHIHMMPEEVVQAAIDLKARRLMPVHWSKFALSLHDWDDSIIRVVKEAKSRNMPLLHPLIGEKVVLDKLAEPVEWWKI